MEAANTDGTIDVFVHLGSYTPTGIDTIQPQANGFYYWVVE